LSMVFTWRMVPEVIQPFWAALQRGEFITGAAEGAGTYRKKGTRWMAAEGGVRPRRGRDLQGGICRSQSGRRSRSGSSARNRSMSDTTTAIPPITSSTEVRLGSPLGYPTPPFRHQPLRLAQNVGE